MKLRGYDLLMDIRRGGYKPKHICLYLFPVKRLPCTHEFIDTDFSTLDEISELADYELDGLRGLDVCLVGKRKDDRLRNACKLLTRIAGTLLVTDGVDLHEFRNGVWTS